MASQLKRFIGDNRGATSIEYAIIASGIAMAIVMTVRLIGDELTQIFENVSAGFD